IYVPIVSPDCSISVSVFFFSSCQSSSFGDLKLLFSFPSLSFFMLPSSFISVVTIKSLTLPIHSNKGYLLALLYIHPFSSMILYHISFLPFGGSSAVTSTTLNE